MRLDRFLFGLALLSAVTMAGTAQAASVNWGGVFEIFTDADIDVSQPFVIDAVNGGPGGAADIPVTIGTTVLNFVSPAAPVLGAGNFGAGGIPEVASTGNAALDEVFESHTWAGGDTSAAGAPFTLSGLNVGQDYQVQIIAAADGRSCCLTRDQVFQDTADGTGNNSGPLLRASDVTASGELRANSVIGTFTADAATQTIWAAGVQDAGISAYIVTSPVPEPTSVALLAAGLGMVAAARRRRP